LGTALLGVALASLVMACQAQPDARQTPSPPRDEPPMSAAEQAQIAQASNAFGLDLYRSVAPKRTGNLAVAPASLTTGLTLAWAGARGETAARLQAALHFMRSATEIVPATGRLARALQDPRRGVTIRLANRLFGDRGTPFERAYLEALSRAHDAGFEALDFKHAAPAARAHINTWVEQQTERRIRDLLPPAGVDAETRLVLVNALYFLGDWEQAFKAERTRPAAFHLDATHTVDVPTMHAGNIWRFAQNEGVQALELPYRGGQFAFLVLRPDALEGLAALERTLDTARLERLTAALTPTPIALALPKFEVDPAESLALADALRALGLGLAFDPERADFTGLANPPDRRERLRLSNVYHKVFVRVDERGTEAAAATAVSMERAGGPPPSPPRMFSVDRPFLFLVRDRISGLVLFVGRVVDPRTR
jgi:serpin B